MTPRRLCGEGCARASTNEARIEILEDGTLGAVTDASLDLVVANSLIQYLGPSEFSRLLDLWRAKLKTGGRLLLADIPTPRSNPLTDAAALLRFGWRGGFLGAASASLARLYLSDYRRLRKELGFRRYGADELEGLLLRRGYGARRSPRNIGHNQGRLCFVAQAGDLPPRVVAARASAIRKPAVAVFDD